MKILVYSDFRQITHSVRPESEIFIELARLGHHLTVCSPSFDDEQYFRTAGIATICTGQTHKISISAIKVLRTELHRGDYDIVCATNSKRIPRAAFAAIGSRATLVCYRGTTRGLKRSDPTSYLDATASSHRCSHRRIASRATGRNRKIVAKNLRTHHHFQRSQPCLLPTLTGLNIPTDGLVAIATARFRPTKGLDVLIEVAGMLADLSNFHLLIVEGLIFLRS